MPPSGPALLPAPGAAPERRRGVELAGLRRLAVELPRGRCAALELASGDRPVLGPHRPALTATPRMSTSGDAPCTGTTWPARAHQPRLGTRAPAAESRARCGSSVWSISPAITPGPELVGEAPAADAARPREVQAESCPRASSTEPPSKLFDPQARCRAGASSPPASRGPRTRRRWSRAAAAGRRPPSGVRGPLEPDAPPCARSGSRPESDARVGQTSRPRRRRPRRRTRSRRRDPGVAASSDTSSSATATRASESASSGETLASASSGCERISWKRTAAHPSASIDVELALRHRGRPVARRGRGGERGLELVGRATRSPERGTRRRARSSPRREAAVNVPSSETSRRRTRGRRPRRARSRGVRSRGAGIGGGAAERGARASRQELADPAVRAGAPRSRPRILRAGRSRIGSAARPVAELQRADRLADVGLVRPGTPTQSAPRGRARQRAPTPCSRRTRQVADLAVAPRERRLRAGARRRPPRARPRARSSGSQPARDSGSSSHCTCRAV